METTKTGRKPQRGKKTKPHKVTPQNAILNGTNASAHQLSIQKPTNLGLLSVSSPGFHNEPSHRAEINSAAPDEAQGLSLLPSPFHNYANHIQPLGTLSIPPNKTGQKGKHRHYSFGPPSYSQSSELMPLPYDIDGVSTGEQLKFLREKFFLDHGCEAAGPTVQESANTDQYDPHHMQLLRSLVSTQDVLEKYGYVIEPLTGEKLENKKRCRGCDKSMSKFLRAKKFSVTINAAQHECGGYPESRTKYVPKISSPSSTAIPCDTSPSGPSNSFRCKFHNGSVVEKRWTCCGQHVSSEPCTGASEHEAREYWPGELASLWQYHKTPVPEMAPSGVFQICRAVAIDCEMGTAESGDSELIRITLIDYFTSAILLDNLVLPDVPMRDLRTRFSGVTWNQMRAAKKEGSCIKGRDNARRAVWKYVGPDTVVIGHSSNNDLTALRWIHKNVVDTFILESGLKREKEELRAQYETQCAETQPTQTAADAQASREGAHMARAVQALEHLSLSSSGPLPSPLESATGQNKSQQGKKKMNGPGPLSLKVLALTRLGREIQTGDRKGHDSLEDAVATRDLAEWHVREKERTLHNNNMGDGAV